MCGICGQYNYKSNLPVDTQSIGRMMDAIIHRGPDDAGHYINGSLGLGFRRLSIIDLAGGHQPMWDREKIVCVVFNGEIYNFPELKEELEKHGHVFQTRSDTEVIIHGYKQWGNDVFNHLNGMFGLAIWDEPKRKLIIARDQMGIKLVYYTADSERLLFGSEIRAILAATEKKPDIDPVSLNLFLRYRYTPSPYTLFKGIQKLAPGTMAIVENGELRVERWYRFKPTPFDPMPSPEEAGEELLAIYKRAIKRQLLSDVPVGLLLSGGVDSNLLLGLMNLQGEKWPTFTVGYGSSFKDDELADAARTAEIFSSRHTSVQIDRETFGAVLTKIVSCLEEPIASSSIVPMYFVCERARKDVKVALVGQGPDELFGGYSRHIGVRYGEYWRSLPGWLRDSVASGVRLLPRNETLKRGLYSLNVRERMRRYQNVFSIMPGETVDSLFQEGLLPARAGDTILDCWADLVPLMSETDELGGFHFLEVRSSLPDELLMYADKLSMAHSLEVRVPYLDREVVEFVERLPAEYKVRNGKGKWIHRQVCNGYLPPEILQRKKRGFAVNVVDEWFRHSLNDKISSVFRDSGASIYSFLKQDAVQKLVSEHVSGKNDNHKILFSLVVFEEWMRVIS